MIGLTKDLYSLNLATKLILLLLMILFRLAITAFAVYSPGSHHTEYTEIANRVVYSIQSGENVYGNGNGNSAPLGLLVRKRLRFKETQE